MSTLVIDMWHRFLTKPINGFFKSISTYYILFNTIIFLIVSSIVFLYENVEHPQYALKTGVFIVGGLQAIGMFLSFGLKMDKVSILHVKLQEIVDGSAQGTWYSLRFDCDIPEEFTDFVSDGAADLYLRSEHNCRRFTRIMGYYLGFHLFTFVAPLIHAIYGIESGIFDAKTFDLPFNFVVPFNTETVSGWCFEWFIQINTGLSYALCMILTTSHFVCSCFYIFAIRKHFDWLIDAIRNSTECIGMEENSRIRWKLWLRTERTLHRSIEIHVKLFEWVFISGALAH